jgi:hypothetical protein
MARVSGRVDRRDGYSNRYRGLTQTQNRSPVVLAAKVMAIDRIRNSDRLAKGQAVGNEQPAGGGAAVLTRPDISSKHRLGLPARTTNRT